MDTHWHVNKGVYEPREDSKLLAGVLAQQDFTGKTVLDIGTGSGIQAYTVLQQGAYAVTAVDINPAALENARENLGRTGVNQGSVTFLESNLFEDVTAQFDVIVFNPPYVPGDEELGTMEEKAWMGGEQGREVIDQFLDRFNDYVVDSGEVFLLQSSLNDIEQTDNRFEEQGFHVSIVAEEKLPWERLVVIRAKK